MWFLAALKEKIMFKQDSFFLIKLYRQKKIYTVPIAFLAAMIKQKKKIVR